MMRRIGIPGMSYIILGIGLFGMCSAALLGMQHRAASAHPAASTSFVRILHASPYVGTADVFVDGAKLLSSFAFGAVTGYASIPPGPHNVQIALVGKGIGAAVLSETLTVSPGSVYTVAALGNQPTSLSLEVFTDNNVLSAGTAKLRVYQLSPDGGAVTVSAAGKTLLSGTSYQNASGYAVVSAGNYTFNVASSASSENLSASASLAANTVSSLFVVGMYNGSPSSELITSQTAGIPGLPNTGSDPNVVSQTGSVQLLAPASAPWTWPLGIASLLMIGCGLYLRRITVKR